MARLGVQRDTLARMLCSHGEDELAERAASITDDELMRIGRLGAYYAFSEDALALGGSMGGARALSLASIDVLEAAAATCADTTPTASSRGDGLRSQTRASALGTVSYGFALRTGNYPVWRAKREETVADPGGSPPPTIAFTMQPTADRTSPSATRASRAESEPRYSNATAAAAASTAWP